MDSTLNGAYLNSSKTPGSKYKQDPNPHNKHTNTSTSKNKRKLTLHLSREAIFRIPTSLIEKARNNFQSIHTPLSIKNFNLLHNIDGISHFPVKNTIVPSTP
jgi:hypothetical protein